MKDPHNPFIGCAVPNPPIYTHLDLFAHLLTHILTNVLADVKRGLILGFSTAACAALAALDPTTLTSRGGVAGAGHDMPSV